MSLFDLGSLVASIKVDSGNSAQAMKELTAKVEALEKQLQGAAPAADKLGKSVGLWTAAFGAAATAASGLLGAMKNIAVESVHLASSVTELNNLLEVTFGMEGKQRVESWSKSAADSMGRSQRQLKEMAGSFQAFLNTQLGQQKAAELSMKMASRAVDMGSFFNTSDTQAQFAIQSGITGTSSEPLRRYGVILTETAVKEYAHAQGIQKKYEKMTEAEKVLLRYEVLMKQTTQTEGDAIKTAGTYANQLKALEGNMDNLKVAIGEQLLPMALAIVNAFNAMAKAALAAGEALSTAGQVWEWANGGRGGFSDIEEGKRIQKRVNAWFGIEDFSVQQEIFEKRKMLAIKHSLDIGRSMAEAQMRGEREALGRLQADQSEFLKFAINPLFWRLQNSDNPNAPPSLGGSSSRADNHSYEGLVKFKQKQARGEISMASLYGVYTEGGKQSKKIQEFEERYTAEKIKAHWEGLAKSKAFTEKALDRDIEAYNTAMSGDSGFTPQQLRQFYQAQADAAKAAATEVELLGAAASRAADYLERVAKREQSTSDIYNAAMIGDIGGLVTSVAKAGVLRLNDMFGAADGPATKNLLKNLDIAGGLIEPILNQLKAVFQYFADNFKQLVDTFISPMGVQDSRFNNALGAAGKGFAANPMNQLLPIAPFVPGGDLIMASVAITTLGSAMMSLAKETESYKRYQTALSAGVDNLVRAMEPLFNNIMPVAGLFILLTRALAVFMGQLLPGGSAASVLIAGFRSLAAGIANLLIMLTNMKIGLIEVTIGFNKLMQNLGLRDTQNANEALERELARAYGERATQMTARGDITGMTDAELTALANAAGDSARSLAAMNRQLTNMPSGFKGLASIIHEGLDASGDPLAGGGGRDGRPRWVGEGGGNHGDSGAGPSSGHGPVTVQGNVIVVANNPDEFRAKLERQMFVRSGTPLQGVSSFLNRS